jgi:ABC-type transport system involved in Fe-S cluster assembly fused permease/ATPase subunit
MREEFALFVLFLLLPLPLTYSHSPSSSSALALLRFIITSEGSITIDGRKLTDTNLDAIRSRMTLVPQVRLLALFFFFTSSSY